MIRKFVVRFDDICPTMDLNQFKKACELVDRYNIKPLIGIIPKNMDPDQIIDPEYPNFWETIKELQDNGWVIALHGLTHVYDQKKPKTILCGKKHSEFAGNSYEIQKEKIRKGVEILNEHGIQTDVFFAPAHTYDSNTLKALRDCGFRYLSDGFSSRPYKRFGIISIPVHSFGVPRKSHHRINTAVVHPSEWRLTDKEVEYDKLLRFIELNKDLFVDYSTIKQEKRGFLLTQKLIEWFNKSIFKLKRVYWKVRRK